MTTSTWIGAGAAVLVALGLGLGFRELGSPDHARLVQLDERRTDDLERIADALREDHRSSLPADSPVDPATGRTYDYRRIDGNRFELCAIFALPTPDPDLTRHSYDAVYGDTRSKSHPAGRACFVYDRVR